MGSSSLYVGSITGLSFICLALTCCALFVPIWGYFEDSNGGGFGSDHGYFGPWKVCKELTYDRHRCGSTENPSRFRPSHFVTASGVAIAVSALSLLFFFILSIVQHVTDTIQKDMLTNKVILSMLAAITTMVTAGTFALQSDDIRRGFRVTWGVSFYLVLVSVVLTIVLSSMSLYELSLSRQIDPSQAPVVRRTRAFTYDNPEHHEDKETQRLSSMGSLSTAV